MYVRDLASGTTTVANVTVDGKIPTPAATDLFGNGDTHCFSPDGRKLAFTEAATNLTGDGVPDPAPDATGTLIPYSATNLSSATSTPARPAW